MSGLIKKLTCADDEDGDDGKGKSLTHKQRQLLLTSLSRDQVSDFEEGCALLTPFQQDLLSRLYASGQDHLFKNWGTANPQHRRLLAQQLESLDREYPDGGLLGYINNAKQLLMNSKNGVNPLDGWKPSVPKGTMFNLATPEYERTEAIGLKEIGRVGFVLVAGGLGERLGFSGIKVS